MIIAPAASAQVFECTNARGVKEFAQFCPPGTVQQRPIGKSSESGAEAATPVPAAAPKSIESQEVEFRKRMLERQEGETKAAQEKTKAEEAERNCLNARTQLQAIEDGQRLTRFDPVTGERIFYGDEERAGEAERQRKVIAEWCK
jgi:Domain of unknown function (DUF4124)